MGLAYGPHILSAGLSYLIAALLLFLRKGKLPGMPSVSGGQSPDAILGVSCSHLRITRLASGDSCGLYGPQGVIHCHDDCLSTSGPSRGRRCYWHAPNIMTQGGNQ
jgi:hypothetical protein